MSIDPILAALADPSRRAIVQRLVQGRATAGQLARLNPSISRPATSQHLRVLVDAGIVRLSGSGRQSPYELVPGPLIVLEGWLTRLLDAWGAAPTSPSSTPTKAVSA